MIGRENKEPFQESVMAAPAAENKKKPQGRKPKGGEKNRVPEKKKERKPVACEEPAFDERIADRDRHMAVMAPAAKEKKAHEGNLVDSRQHMGAAWTVTFPGD